MPNVMLTYRCNLRCSYCFANEFVNGSNVDITPENFKKAIDFLTSDGECAIGLIGGEPTIHPHFSEYLEQISQNEKIVRATIYTNGLLISDFIDYLKNEKFYVLVNCNSPKVIGESNFENLVKQLDLLYSIEDAKNRVSLGINLYSDSMDYSYILELAKRYNVHRLRMSVTVPNLSENKDQSSMEYLRSRKKFTLQFIKDCAENQILPYYDCNSIPQCIWNGEEIKEIQAIIDGFGVKRTNLLGYHSFCRPVIDILPNLNAVRCFGMSDFLKVPISDFSNLGEIRDYFINMIDSYVYHIPCEKDCKTCHQRQSQRCAAGCMAFVQHKLDKISEAKVNKSGES